MAGGSRRVDLASAGERALERLEETHAAREIALSRCRETIRACGLAIRSMHREQAEDIRERLDKAERALREAQTALRPFPQLAAVGFLHDAEKEYAEARLTRAFLFAEVVPSQEELQVGLPAWLNGLAEAASELRRDLLDSLRSGDTSRAEELFETMEEVLDLLVSVEYPDAITGGLRRAADALRAVVERSRADMTTTVLQANLQHAIESHGSGG